MEYILHVKNCKHGDGANSEVEKRSSNYNVTTDIKNLFIKLNKNTYNSFALNISGQRNNSSHVPFLTLCQFVERKKRLTLLRTWLYWHPEAAVQFPKQCNAHLFKATRSKGSRVWLVIFWDFIQKPRKRTKYSLLCEEWNPVRKSPEDVLVFFGFGGPADILGSVYWEIYSEHLSTSHLLDFEALIICITV